MYAHMYVCVNENLSDWEEPIYNILWDTSHQTMESVAAEETERTQTIQAKSKDQKKMIEHTYKVW